MLDNNDSTSCADSKLSVFLSCKTRLSEGREMGNADAVALGHKVRVWPMAMPEGNLWVFY